MSKKHLITREIGIDMGHRVTYHGSKCKNLHGHRYTIQATCSGPLYEEGEQQGMVLDFGFLKTEMMDIIDKYCDHGMVLWVEDPIVQKIALDNEFIEHLIQTDIDSQGWSFIVDEHEIFGKLYVVNFVPTAENLAKHWYDRLKPRVAEITGGQATLEQIKAWETPNCSAQYPV